MYIYWVKPTAIDDNGSGMQAARRRNDRVRYLHTFMTHREQPPCVCVCLRVCFSYVLARRTFIARARRRRCRCLTERRGTRSRTRRGMLA